MQIEIGKNLSSTLISIIWGLIAGIIVSGWERKR